MIETREDFRLYLRGLKPEGLYNPYLDKGYELRVMDTCEALPQYRFIQGVALELSLKRVSINYRKWSLVTTTDLVHSILSWGAKHEYLNDSLTKVEIFEYLEEGVGSGPRNLWLFWPQDSILFPNIPCECFLFYPVFSHRPDEIYFNLTLDLTKIGGEVFFHN